MFADSKNIHDERHIKLLKAIQQLAGVFYPYPDGESCDPRYPLALGQIMGICMKTLKGD